MTSDGSLFGRTDHEWEVLTDGTVQFLREQAGLGRTTNYTEVNQTLQRRHGARSFDFDLDSERAAMGHLLGLAVDAEYDTTGLMISSIVLYLNENDAGPGFYKKAEELGLVAQSATAADKQRFWVEQVAAVQERYREPRRRRPSTG